MAGGNPNSGIPRKKGFAQVPPRAAPAEHQPHGPSMTPMEMCHQKHLFITTWDKGDCVKAGETSYGV